jgi:hypothetical protein
MKRSLLLFEGIFGFHQSFVGWNVVMVLCHSQNNYIVKVGNTTEVSEAMTCGFQSPLDVAPWYRSSLLFEFIVLNLAIS